MLKNSRLNQKLYHMKLGIGEGASLATRFELSLDIRSVSTDRIFASMVPNFLEMRNEWKIQISETYKFPVSIFHIDLSRSFEHIYLTVLPAYTLIQMERNLLT